MQLYNSLTKEKSELPNKESVGIYSCGPTVYDSVHIGNLYAFIAADTLRRALKLNGLNTKHVMNITDIDDKTIRKCHEEHADLQPKDALTKTTQKYTEVFLNDIESVGIDTQSIDFIKATDSIEQMQSMITELVDAGVGYTADDGVYFSIEKYVANGGRYGQLGEINADNTSSARIDNDEYDKDSVHDFALWKKQKPGEPAWAYEVNGIDMTGRPGWHIECSAMSKLKLGQPFDIHTGGVDLKFPHHENEIAQSTATGTKEYANYFLHNEHVMVDGQKMSKSLNNFYTLNDIVKKGFEPTAFRLLAIQSHYRKRANFSWDNLEAAKNRLASLRAMAEHRWQAKPGHLDGQAELIDRATNDIKDALADDLNTPKALEAVSIVVNHLDESHLSVESTEVFNKFLETLDSALGLNLVSSTPDIPEDTKKLLEERKQAREANDYDKSDSLRDQLDKAGYAVLDTAQGQIWHRK